MFLVYYYCTTCFVRCSAMSDWTPSKSSKFITFYEQMNRLYTHLHYIWKLILYFSVLNFPLWNREVVLLIVAFVGQKYNNFLLHTALRPFSPRLYSPNLTMGVCDKSWSVNWPNNITYRVRSVLGLSASGEMEVDTTRAEGRGPPVTLRRGLIKPRHDEVRDNM